MFLPLKNNSAFAQEKAEAGLAREIFDSIMNHKAEVGAGAAAVAAGVEVINNSLKNGEAAYVLQYQMDPNKIRWTRLIGWPNVFAVVMIEGTGQYVIPDIFYNYRGGEIISTFKVPKIPAGSSISVFILDDHSAADQIWNNILSTRWTTQVNAETTMTEGIVAEGSVSGTLQLLDTHVTIVGPTPMGQHSENCPWYARFKNTWQINGSLLDSSDKAIGTVSFSQIIAK